jgi:hypothetical protein
MSEALNSYKKLQEKFGLPQLDKLQSAFKFEVEENDDLDDIRNEISSKLFEFTENIIEPLLWSSHYCHIVERDMLAAKENPRIFEFYKQIQALRWRNNMLTISPNAEETARWIVDFWSFWGNFEHFASTLCTKFSRGWENLIFKETVTEYQG